MRLWYNLGKVLEDTGYISYKLV